MPHARNSSQRTDERGQLFTAWIVGIFIIAAMILYVTDTMRRERLSTQSIIYRELALNVAKAGFEEGESYFRLNEGSCFLTANEAPTSQAWITPWPTYPDAAFQPTSSTTDFYNSISLACSICTGGFCAGGIIGDVPMDQYVTFTTTEDARTAQLWGRYVVRRQNIQNWSPGPDTATANTDPDACHDISAISAQSPLGSGTRWSIVSRGYIVRLPQPITFTAGQMTVTYTASLLGNAAAFNDNNMLSAPVTFYHNQPFLLGQARVYGEISRVILSLPPAAAVMPGGGTTLQLNGSAALNSNGLEYAYDSTAAETVTGGCGAACIYGNTTDTAWTSLGSVFPGHTMSTLLTTAQSLEGGSSIAGYTSANDLPIYSGSGGGFNSYTGLSYAAQVALPAFYFINSSLTLTSSATNTAVLSGVGLCVVNGSLDINQSSPSNWAGILYASGQITLQGSASVNGILISNTGITLGGGGSSSESIAVTYDPDIVSYVQGLLQDFTVDSSSIVSTGF